MTGLERAIFAAKSMSALARELGVSSAAPSMWKSRGNVPAEYCPAIERFTKNQGAIVTCEELRPDIPWGVLRHQPAGITEKRTGPVEVLNHE